MTDFRKLGLAFALALPAFLVLSPEAPADRVITKDGRIVKPKKARKEGDNYRLIFEHGEILVTDPNLVKSVEIEGDMSDYVPQNEDEKKKLEDGYVKYQGKWMSKRVYERELQKEFEESKKRLEEMAKYTNWNSALELETKHFLFRTNTSPELLKYYSDLIETYYKLMDKRIGINPTPSMKKTKMTVNIWKSREEFQKLAEPAVESPGVAGFFFSGNNTLNFYHDYAEPESSDWIGLHECTHLITYLIDQQYRPQIWINEAAADYFGSSTITFDKRGRPQIEPGKLQTDRVLTVQQAFKDDSYIRLADLFFLTRDEFQAFQYAHAWSFVYFLNNYDNGKYQKGFNKFFKNLYTTAKGVPYDTEPSYGKAGVGKVVKPADIRDFLLKMIKVKDLPDLETKWKEFIGGIVIEGPDALLKRGIRATWRGDFESALKDLDEAINLGSLDPRAFMNRAVSRALTDRSRDGLDAATEDMKKGVELHPLNASYRYRLSRSLVGFLSTGGTDIDEDTELPELDDEEAKKHAGLAMELDPENEMYEIWFDAFD